MPWTNQETFQSTVQAHNGATSLYYDGTAPANNTDQPMFTIPDIDFTSDFTIEFFQYTEGSGLISPVTISGRDSSKYIIFWPNSTSAFLQWFKPSDDGVIFKNFSVSPTMLGRWVHMAMSYDSVTDTVHFAVDGVVNSYTEGLSTVFMTGTDVPQADFLIWPQGHTSRMFNGYVDDFRVTQSALYTTAYTVPDPIVDLWAVGGTTLYYENMEPPVVNWVLNGSSQYEVSSKNHLLNIMTQGSTFANTGSVPPNFWTASYIQTADIDLADDSSITPIGTNASRFTGQYDGDSFSISNWRYETAGVDIGLFGGTNTGCILKNISLAGTWYLDVNFTGNGGFLCGRFENSTAYNCEGDFAVGTYQGVTTNAFVQHGTMIGIVKTSTVQGFSIKGSVDVDPASTSSKGYGGLFGNTEKSNMKFIRNAAHFPSGIKNQNRASGIVATSEQDYEWSHVVNSMTGDIWGSTSSGIFSYIRLGTGATTTIDNVVLSMTGNIANTTGTIAGGALAADVTTAFEPITFTGFANYMSGDAQSATIRTASSGTNDLTIQDSIIAPNGTFTTVDTNTNNTTGTFTETTKYDDSFGLTFTTNNGGSSTGATLSAAFLTHSQFGDLPYLDISGTDDDGNSYDWDFIYANVGGNATEYPDYTHAILHKDDVSSPFVVDYDTVSSGFNGTTLQVTFANFGTDTVYVQLAFTVTSTTAGTTTTFSFPSPLTVTPGAITISVLLEDAGAIAYRLGVTPSGGSEFISIDSTTSLTPLISNVLPETGYTVSLYTDTGSGFVFVASEATTTLVNSAANYTAGGADFADGSGGFDLSDLNDDSLALFSEVMDSLFSTGDDLDITLSGITRETTYAKVGGTLVVDKADTEPIVSIGFSGTALQTSTIDLTDDADVSTQYGVDFDPITDPVKASYTINGVTYYAGDSFILNGKKVTLVEF